MQLNQGLPLLGGHERLLERAFLFHLHKAKTGTTWWNIQFFQRHIFAMDRLFFWGDRPSTKAGFRDQCGKWKDLSRLTGMMPNEGVSLAGGSHEGAGVIWRESCLRSSKRSGHGDDGTSRILSGVRKRTNFTDPFGLWLGPLILTREMYKT